MGQKLPKQGVLVNIRTIDFDNSLTIDETVVFNVGDN